jgi:hypothetical protein
LQFYVLGINSVLEGRALADRSYQVQKPAL